MMKHIYFIFFLVLTPGLTHAQEIIDLYSGPIPNSKPAKIKADVIDENGLIRKVVTPTLEVFLPEKENATDVAVVICPGGGYSVLVYNGEGVRAAKELAKNGVTAFVLKYRLPNDSLMIDKNIGPLQDGLQAIKVVRENATRWNIDPAKIGIMGFSAGGHLASTVATHYKKDVIENTEHTSLRPDFLILIYPVISMQDSLTHLDSRTKLLGPNPDKKLIDEYSNEMQVNAETPPTYLTHAGDDKLVTVENSIIFYQKLNQNNVPAEMHIYPKGNHGFVLFQPTEDWINPIIKWMNNSGWIKK